MLLAPEVIAKGNKKRDYIPSMQIRLFKFWEEIKSSYWFVPGTMVLVAVLLSLGTVALDEYFREGLLGGLGFLWNGGAESARALLQTIATSMATVAGVTFSITMVALSFASAELGSRLLRNFMSDIGNQLVLGTFISTFMFCLLALRMVRSGEQEFVPYLSLTVGVLLALLSLVVLIYFIHHMALSMQSAYVIGGVATDLLGAIERLFPSQTGKRGTGERDAQKERDLPRDFEKEAATVRTGTNGYIQAIDQDELMKLASEHDLILQLPQRPGHFLIDGDVLACVWPGDRLNNDLEKRLKKAFLLGKQRTMTQDVEYGIEQLVEVAERALSVGSNSTFTAIAGIDWLGAALARVEEKGVPSPYRYDGQGKLRLFFSRPLTLKGMIDTAFNQIRQAARYNMAARIRLLEKIVMLSERVDDTQAQEALKRQATMIQHDSTKYSPEGEDREEMQERYRKIMGTDAEQDSSHVQSDGETKQRLRLEE
jgi:uncharacterized membrane protein